MKNLLIAVVEDDDDDREFICNALGDENRNIEIVPFSNAEDFFSFLPTSRKLPDLVVTDLRMPLISGFDVIQRMKASEVTQHTTIVVLSTSSSEDDIQKAKNLGAAGYFVKPYNLKGYEEIKSKILTNLGFNSLLFTNVIKNFLVTFKLLLPEPL